MAVLHACRDLTILKVERCKYGAGAESLVFMIAADLGILPGTGGRSGAVLQMACTPGFSFTETVITLEAVSPAARLAFCSAIS